MRQNTTISDKINKSIHRKVAKSYHKGVLSPEISIETIQAITCKEFGVLIEEILSKTSEDYILIPRQVSMVLCREFIPKHTLDKIGKSHGCKNHYSVLTAIKSVKIILGYDIEKTKKINKITQQLNELILNN